MQVRADWEATTPSLHPQQPVLPKQDMKLSCKLPTDAPCESADKPLLIAWLFTAAFLFRP